MIAGLALPAGQHPDLDPKKVVERPRVLYNDPTQRFVMWMHIDTSDYELASCGMATSASPTGWLFQTETSQILLLLYRVQGRRGLSLCL